MGTKFCPNCGCPIDEFVNEKRSNQPEGLVFPIHNIVLGQTTIKELYDAKKYYKIGKYDLEEGGRCIWLTPSIYAVAISDQSGIYGIGSFDYNDVDVWNQILPLHQDISVNEVSRYCKQHNLRHVINLFDDVIVVILRDGHHIMMIDTDTEQISFLRMPQCPECEGDSIILKIDRHELEFQCESCKHIFTLSESIDNRMNKCPQCGSESFEDDGTDYLQFKCNDCGCTWGREIEDDDEYE